MKNQEVKNYAVLNYVLKNKDDKSKVDEILYYADAIHVRKYGFPITTFKYIKKDNSVQVIKDNKIEKVNYNSFVIGFTEIVALKEAIVRSQNFRKLKSYIEAENGEEIDLSKEVKNEEMLHLYSLWNKHKND